MVSELAGQRVAVVVKSVCARAGVATAVLHYCRALRTLGADPKVLVLTHEADAADSFRAEGLDIRVMGLSKHSRRLATSRALGEALRALAPDWVHAHCYEPSVHASRAVARGLASRLAVILHDSRRRPARRLIARPYRRTPELIIAPSASVARSMGAWYGYPPERMAVLPHPVESRFFRAQGTSESVRAELGIPKHAPVVLWTARLQRHKGHADLLRAFKSVVPQFPSACLVLAGTGKLETGLRGLANRLRLAERVRFAGMRDDVPELLALADLFCCPSHSETLCISVQEAMAAGTPVVSTCVWGPDEHIRHGESGLLVPVGRPEALGRAIVELLGDRSRAEAMGAEARSHAMRHFSTESFTRSLGLLMTTGAARP